MRQIILDTETTGLEWKKGNRIVEIGCVELFKRRPTGNNYHQYIKPDCEFEQGAQEVTGLTLEFLEDKPDFAQIADEFLAFIDGAELIIHNAAFDLGFLDNELSLLGPQYGKITDRCTVIDTLVMARERFPGQRNSLDALCKRLGVDNSHRALHGGLLDAQILGDVYIALTSGQEEIGFGLGDEEGGPRCAPGCPPARCPGRRSAPSPSASRSGAAAWPHAGAPTVRGSSPGHHRRSSSSCGSSRASTGSGPAARTANRCRARCCTARSASPARKWPPSAPSGCWWYALRRRSIRAHGPCSAAGRPSRRGQDCQGRNRRCGFRWFSIQLQIR